MKKGITLLERYLSAEIGIEFKSCLYFFCFLFFYSLYRIITGSFEASILHMAEMICATYVMGYIQVYFLSNFDEGEHFGRREILYSLICTMIYALIAHFGNWFDRNLIVAGFFFVYVEIAYVCAYLVYKIKRDIDTRMLNMDLRAFQERRERMEKNGEGNRD